MRAIDEGDLEHANRFLSNNFEMVCSGNIKLRTLAEFVERSQNQYQTILSTNISLYGLGAIFFCHGMFAGRWLDGSAFSDVRFIDRFDVSEGLITLHENWNDLAFYGH